MSYTYLNTSLVGSLGMCRYGSRPRGAMALAIPIVVSYFTLRRVLYILKYGVGSRADTAPGLEVPWHWPFR